MTVETATYISELDEAKPLSTDLKSEGDDHFRLIKSVLKSTFPKADSTNGALYQIKANRTYYVATTGVDTDDGLTALTPLLTIQKAIDIACSFDTDVYTITISIANGTYDPFLLKPWSGAGVMKIVGNSATPSSVLITGAGLVGLTASNVGEWHIDGLKFETLEFAIYAEGATTIRSIGLIDFGTCTVAHIVAARHGIVTFDADYSVSGGSNYHWYATGGGVIAASSRTITITGTPAFTAWLASDRGLGYIEAYGMTFTGTATGKRYALAGNAVCFVNGAGTTYLPGNATGTSVTGSQYF